MVSVVSRTRWFLNAQHMQLEFVIIGVVVTHCDAFPKNWCPYVTVVLFNNNLV